MSVLLDRAVAAQVVEAFLPTIESFLRAKMFDGPNLHIVIANPSIIPGTIDREEWFKRGILFEYTIGEERRSTWNHPFDRIARSKCYLSWRWQMSTWEIQHNHQHLLIRGDTTYWGSVGRNGYATACSGLNSDEDEVLSDLLHNATHFAALSLQTAPPAVDAHGFVT